MEEVIKTKIQHSEIFGEEVNLKSSKNLGTITDSTFSDLIAKPFPTEVAGEFEQPNENLLSGKEVILNENWDYTASIQSVIVHSTKNEVFLDCLIDIENKIFEHRSFPSILFNHLTNLNSGDPVIIKTKEKSGSFRIDVYSGRGLVNKSLFDINEGWKELENSGLDEKLTEW